MASIRSLSNDHDDNELERLLPLLRAYYERLIAFIAGMLPAHIDRVSAGEAIVSDVSVLVVQKIRAGQFQWLGEEAFLSWLMELARGKCRDWVKHETRDVRDMRRTMSISGYEKAHDSSSRVGDDLNCVDVHTPGASARRQDRKIALHSALEQLGELERAVISMRYFEMLSVEAVAHEVQLSPGRVRNICVDAKRELRQYLGDASQIFSSK